MQSPPRTKLEEDMLDLLESGYNSDLMILCQEEEIRAHRGVLSARSPVFRGMLESGMLEELKGRVQVEDAEPVILRQLVRYLYTGRVEPDFRDYKKLMVLANKYQVEDLVDYTSKKILETLAKDNALELGIFGETHNSTILLNAAAQFIQENISPETLPEGWEQQLKGSPQLTLAISLPIIGAARERCSLLYRYYC